LISAIIPSPVARHPAHDLETYDELARTKDNNDNDNSLAAQLEQIGLCALPAQLDDFIGAPPKPAGRSSDP